MGVSRGIYSEQSRWKPWHLLPRLLLPKVTQSLESLEIVINRIAPIMEVCTVLNQIGDDRGYIVLGVEAQHIFRFLNADLIVPKV